MLTVDSHFTDGYVCNLCSNDYENQLSNVVQCADHQVASFIRWIQEQDFYENTTIVITGDHLYMDHNFFSEVYDYYRKIYVNYINPIIEPVQTQAREYCSLDIYPTLLGSIGVSIPGNRLGLGTNLFSEQQTLIEELGLQEFDEQLNQRSNYYNKNILNKK